MTKDLLNQSRGDCNLSAKEGIYAACSYSQTLHFSVTVSSVRKSEAVDMGFVKFFCLLYKLRGTAPINGFMHCSTWTLENENLRKQPVKQETPQTSQKETQRSMPKVSAQSQCRD